MYSLPAGNIIPGVGVGILRLGMTYREVCAITTDFTECMFGTIWEIHGGNFRLNIDPRTGQVVHITVFGDFSGTLDHNLSLGAIWGNVIERETPYFEVPNMAGVYTLDKYRNTYFELGDTEDENDWSPVDAPIERIGIFSDVFTALFCV